MGMPLPTPTYWTTDLLATLPDDGQRYELVHGELLVSPAPSPRHQRIAGLLYAELRAWLAPLAVGEVFAGPLSLTRDDDTEVQPDVMVAPLQFPRAERWQDLGRPLLVVEVLSPTTARHDRFPKRLFYQQLGVPLYWIVDPEDAAVEIWTPADRFPRVERELLRWHPDGAPAPWEIEVARLLQG